MHSPAPWRGCGETFKSLLLGLPAAPGSQEACVPYPLLTGKLQVQFLKRQLNVEGVPGDPEQEAEGQDQGP